MTPPFPHRPRLLKTIGARLHLVDGSPKVILHEWRTGKVIELDYGSWHVLQVADGTRDLNAICLAVAREGVYQGESAILEVLQPLHDLGLLGDGIEPPTTLSPVAPPAPTPAERSLESLPAYRFHCDSSGSCCRFYGSVAFTQFETMKARVVGESLSLPIHPEDAFTPLRGAQSDGAEIHTVAQVDGRCLFLDEDNLCGIHRRADMSWKPVPCQVYPTTLVDDGHAIRVSVMPECVCVYESDSNTLGAPLLPETCTQYGDLDMLSVRVLPDPVALSEMRSATRLELRRWSAHVEAYLRQTEISPVHLSWTLAQCLERYGLDENALENALQAHQDTLLDEITPYIDALRSLAQSASECHGSWRSGSDLSRQTAEWLASALAKCDNAALLTLPEDRAHETFYLRALIFGHRIVVDGRPLTHGLRDRATRILASRAMRAHAPEPCDPSQRVPLSLLEASMRNLGLRAYLDHVIVPPKEAQQSPRLK